MLPNHHAPPTAHIQRKNQELDNYYSYARRTNGQDILSFDLYSFKMFSMNLIKVFISATTFSIIVLFNTSYSQNQDKDSIIEAISSTIGGQQKWNNTRYFLFTVSSTPKSSAIGKDRTFLFDKEDSYGRFEGVVNNKNVIFIFNYKTKAGIKLFQEGKEVSTIDDALTQDVMNQFFEDSKLLLFPVYFLEKGNNLSVGRQKIINSEKIYTIDYSNIDVLNDDNLSGSISATYKGELKSLRINGKEYTLSNPKDIGNGINLVTQFKNIQKPDNSVIFTTVAAFTEIESGKFSNP